MDEITQSEFIRRYCEKSNITEEQLNSLGMFSVVCDCGSDGCTGWATETRKTITDHIELNVFGKE